MGISTHLAIFFLIWWISLFAVLPFGIRSQHEDGDFPEGTDPGAPVRNRIGRKLIWTTLVAAVFYVIFYFIYTSGYVTADKLMSWFGPTSR
jgi:predicted secreted protein